MRPQPHRQYAQTTSFLHTHIQIANKLFLFFTHTCLDYNRLNVLATTGSMSWPQQAVSQLPDDAQPLIVVALDPVPYTVDEQQDVTTAADTAAMRKAFCVVSLVIMAVTDHSQPQKPTWSPTPHGVHVVIVA